MTNQEKKEYLRRYLEAEAEAARLQEEIARWRSKAERTTTTIGQVPGGSGSDRLQGAVEAIDGLAKELGERRKKSVVLRQSVDRAISGVTDARLRRLLRYRYIDGVTWEEIAEKMSFEVRWTLVLHGRALSAITAL